MFFFCKQSTAYGMLRSLVGSEMCIRDRSWAIAAIVSATGGFLLGYMRGIDFGLAEIGLIAMAAALVGGLESFKGAILGGVIMGVAEALTGGYIGHGLKEVIPYIIMVLVLIYKPYGLFGLEKIERV